MKSRFWIGFRKRLNLFDDVTFASGLALSAHGVVEEVVVGEFDAVFEFCLVCPLRQAQDRR